MKIEQGLGWIDHISSVKHASDLYGPQLTSKQQILDIFIANLADLLNARITE